MNDVFFAELPLPKPHVQLRSGRACTASRRRARSIELERVFVDLQPDLVVVPGRRQLHARRRARRGQARIPVCHLEAGLAQLRLVDARGAQPPAHRPPVGLAPHPQRRRATRISPPKGIAARIVVRREHDDRHAARERGRSARLAAWREFGLEPGGYVLVTLHRPRSSTTPTCSRETIAGARRCRRGLPVSFRCIRGLERNLEAGSTRRAADGAARRTGSFSRSRRRRSGRDGLRRRPGGDHGSRIPCFTLRENTERPITIELGTNTLLGLEPEKLRELPALLAEPKLGQIPPLWDGHAGERAAEAIERLLVGATA